MMSTPKQQDIFKFLDALKSSGKINMNLAQYHVQDWFGLDSIRSRILVSQWRKSVDC